MYVGDKTGLSRLFFKHCEQADHQPAILPHLEKVEAIEVLHCTSFNVLKFEIYFQVVSIYINLYLLINFIWNILDISAKSANVYFL